MPKYPPFKTPFLKGFKVWGAFKGPQMGDPNWAFIGGHPEPYSPKKVEKGINAGAPGRKKKFGGLNCPKKPLVPKGKKGKKPRI